MLDIKVDNYETGTETLYQGENPGGLSARVGDHAGLTREKVAPVDAPVRCYV